MIFEGPEHECDYFREYFECLEDTDCRDELFLLPERVLDMDRDGGGRAMVHSFFAEPDCEPVIEFSNCQGFEIHKRPIMQCWGSEQFFSDSDSDPVLQTNSDSDSAPFGSGSE